MQDPPHPGADWPLVLLLLGAGVVGAFQIGKVPPALPGMRSELGLGLVAAGWVISIYAVVTAAAGVFGGALADAAGHRRAVLFGLICLSAGNLVGAGADSAAMVLAGRFVESVGYISIVVAVPPLMAVAAGPGEERFALGIWGSHMPSGTAAMMLLSPLLLAAGGWRGVWLANGLLAAIYAVVIACWTRHLGVAPKATQTRSVLHGLWRDIRAVLAKPAPVLLALVFATYTLNFIAVFGFLPTLLIDEIGVGVNAAALLTAFAVAVNIIGNVGGGWLRKHDVPLRLLLIAGSAVMGVSALGIYSETLAGGARFALCVVFSLVGGIIPGSVLGAAPLVAPSRTQVAATTGLLVQGSQIGSLAGPPALAAVVAAGGGWHAAPWLITVAALCGVILAIVVARVGSGLDREGA